MQAMTYCLLCGVGAMKDEGEDGNRRVRDALARKVVFAYSQSPAWRKPHLPSHNYYAPNTVVTYWH